MSINFEGKIAAILSPAKVVINRGSNDGVEVGDYFYIYSEVGPFSDPDTKQDLGTTKQVWGKVEVSIVENRFCIAETESRYTNPIFNSISLAAMFGTTVQKIKLPVHEGQIWKGLEKIEIGFPARLVKRTPESADEDEQLEDYDEIEELPSAQPSLLGPATLEHTSYRRKKGHDTWHFCSTCSNWPVSDYDSRPEKPSDGLLCNECSNKMAGHSG
jgi:hypothetical protein